MTTTLEFLITRLLSDAEVALFITAALPEYDAANISASEAWNNQTITYSVQESEDPERWVCLLDLYNFPTHSRYGEFAEIKLAEQLCKRFRADVIVSTNKIVSGLDLHDPYWCLALIDGTWHFASSAESRFMIGDADVVLPPIQQQPRLITPLNLSKPKRGLFAYRDLVKG